MAIDLIVEVEIRSKPTGASGIDAALGIAKDELAGGRLAVVIENIQPHANGRFAGEYDGELIAKAEILRALANIKDELSFSLAFVTAVDLQDAIVELEAGELFGQGLRIVGHQVHPAIG